jgi:toxin ParE1/3/4
MAYVLAPSALADVREIARYTCQQWGADQARRYRDSLELRFEMLASGKGQFKDLSHLVTGLRMIRCEHHYIFGQIRNGQPAAILAVFHERMDLMTRLSERLTIR